MNTDILPSLVPKLKPIFDYLNNFIEANYLMSLFFQDIEEMKTFKKPY